MPTLLFKVETSWNQKLLGTKRLQGGFFWQVFSFQTNLKCRSKRTKSWDQYQGVSRYAFLELVNLGSFFQCLTDHHTISKPYWYGNQGQYFSLCWDSTKSQGISTSQNVMTVESFGSSCDQPSKLKFLPDKNMLKTYSGSRRYSLSLSPLLSRSKSLLPSLSLSLSLPLSLSLSRSLSLCLSLSLPISCNRSLSRLSLSLSLSRSLSRFLSL